MHLPEPDDLLEEQIDYYRARAPEYDDWWLRTGRYAPDDDFGRRWEAGKDDLDDALRAFAPTGDVLELAAGTGNLTASLAAIEGVEHITAVDSSEEALAIARTKVPDATASRLRPGRRVHAGGRRASSTSSRSASGSPTCRRSASSGFWHLVGEALRPGGRVFFIDNAVPVEQAAAANGRHGRHSLEPDVARSGSERPDPR